MRREQQTQFIEENYREQFQRQKEKSPNESSQPNAKGSNDVDNCYRDINLNNINNNFSFFNQEDTYCQSQQIKQCINNKQAVHICINSNCGQNSYICNDRNCSCRQLHQQCNKKELTYLRKQTQKMKKEIEKRIKQEIIKSKFVKAFASQCLNKVINKKELFQFICNNSQNQIKKEQGNEKCFKESSQRGNIQIELRKTSNQNSESMKPPKLTYDQSARVFRNYSILFGLVILVLFFACFFNKQTIIEKIIQISGAQGYAGIKTRLKLLEQNYSNYTSLIAKVENLNLTIQVLKQNSTQSHTVRENAQKQMNYLNQTITELQIQNDKQKSETLTVKNFFQDLNQTITKFQHQIDKQKQERLKMNESASQKMAQLNQTVAKLQKQIDKQKQEKLTINKNFQNLNQTITQEQNQDDKQKQEQFKNYLLKKVFNNDTQQLETRYNINENLQKNVFKYGIKWWKQNIRVKLQQSKLYLYLNSKTINMEEFIANFNNNHLQYLSLNDCQIDDGGFEVLMRNFDKFKELKILDLYNNNITQVSSKYLEKLPSSLGFLQLGKNPLSQSSIAQLKSFQKKRPAVRVFITINNKLTCSLLYEN